MFKVKRRDGTIIDFDLTKIRNAVEKAFVATNVKAFFLGGQ